MFALLAELFGDALPWILGTAAVGGAAVGIGAALDAWAEKHEKITDKLKEKVDQDIRNSKAELEQVIENDSNYVSNFLSLRHLKSRLSEDRKILEVNHLQHSRLSTLDNSAAVRERAKEYRLDSLTRIKALKHAYKDAESVIHILIAENDGNTDLIHIAQDLVTYMGDVHKVEEYFLSEYAHAPDKD